MKTLWGRYGERIRGPLLQSLATGAFSQVILVGSGVVVARSLGPHNRGVLALLTFLPLLVSQIVNAGIPLSVTYAIAGDGVSPARIGRRLRTTVLAQFAIAEVAHGILIAVLLAPKSPSGFVAIGVVSLVLSAAALAQSYGLAVLQGERRFTSFNVLRIGPASAYMIFVLGLAAVGDATLSWIALAWITANVGMALATVVAVARGRGRYGADVEAPPLRELLSFGARSMLGSASPISSYRLDQLLVGAVLTADTLGLYVVASAFTNLTRFLGQSIGMVAYPTIAMDQDPAVLRRKIRNYFAIGAALCTSTTVALVIGVPWLLPFFFGRSFDGAVGPARVLLVATLASSLRRILADATRGAGQPAWGTFAELATLVALPLALLAVSLDAGLLGVAFALLVGDALGLLVLLPALGRPTVAPRFVRFVAHAQQNLVVVPVALLTAVVGFAVASMHGRLSLITLVTAIGAIGVIGVRLWQKEGPLQGQGAKIRRRGGLALSHLAVARLFFFAGLLTLGLLTIRPVSSLTISDLLFLVSVLFAALYLFQSDADVRYFLPFGVRVGTLVFCFGGLLTALFIPDPWPTVAVVLRVAYLLCIWLVLPVILLTNRRLVILAAACWTASAALGASGAIIQWLYGNVIPGGQIAYGRYTGFTDHFNQLGGLVATAVPVAIALLIFAFRQRGRQRIVGIAVFLAIFGVLVAGLMLTGSVTGFLASAAAVLVLVTVLRMSLRARLAVVLLGVLSVVYLPSLVSTGYTSNPLQRLSGATSNASQGAGFTADERVIDYRIAWHRIEHDPVIGVGLAGSTSRTTHDGAPGNVVHNILLGSWHQAGIFGLVGIAMVLMSLVNMTRVALRGSDPTWHLLAAGLAGSVVATFVEGLGQPILFQRYCWIAFALLLNWRAMGRPAPSTELALSERRVSPLPLSVAA